nr:MFS transporter [Arthrobacter ruber]
MCVLRLAQGFAVGGEWGRAVIIAVENAPKGRRGFYGSWPQIGVSCGLLLGTVAVAAAAAISGDQFETWGWHVPFLLSVILAAVGLYIRLNAAESPEFLAEKAKMEKNNVQQKAPLRVLLAHHRKPLLITIFGRFAEAGNYYLFTVFVLSYVTTSLEVPRQYGLTAVMIGSVLNIIMIPVFGRFSDRIGRKMTFFSAGRRSSSRRGRSSSSSKRASSGRSSSVSPCSSPSDTHSSTRHYRPSTVNCSPPPSGTRASPSATRCPPSC